MTGSQPALQLWSFCLQPTNA